MATKLTFKQFFHTWTQELLKWLTNKFDSIQIDTSELAKQGINQDATNTAILAKFDDITIDTSNLATKAVEQWLGLEESYEAEAKGGERTNNTVIDECKVRFQDAFNGLLPTGFTMPNSVTVDNLTYTGTTNS